MELLTTSQLAAAIYARHDHIVRYDPTYIGNDDAFIRLSELSPLLKEAGLIVGDIEGREKFTQEQLKEAIREAIKNNQETYCFGPSAQDEQQQFLNRNLQ